MAGELLADLNLGYAIVRVYAGERTKEQREEAIINAGKRFAESIIKSGKRLDEVCSVCRSTDEPDLCNTSRMERSESGKTQRNTGKCIGTYNNEQLDFNTAYIF